MEINIVYSMPTHPIYGRKRFIAPCQNIASFTEKILFQVKTDVDFYPPK